MEQEDDLKFSSQDSFVESWNNVAHLERNDSFTQLLTSNPIINYNEDVNQNDHFEFLAESITGPFSDGFLTSSIQELFGNLDGVLCSQDENGFQTVQLPEQQQQLQYEEPTTVDCEQVLNDVKPLPQAPIMELPDSTHGCMIPSNVNYPGKYGFNLFFKEQNEKMTKSTSFTYSDVLDKLFINMGSSCIVYFKVEEMPPNGCVLRALPIFEKAEYVREVVKRCPTHCLPTDASNFDHIAPDHLVRCDNDLAQYNVDAISNRLSVIVPFVAPQAGTEHTNYLYKFMCFGSCVGGLNRRPIMLIFTLEKDGKVLGRRSLRVRICACPGRDRKSEEKAFYGGGSTRKNTGVVQTVTSDIVVCGPPSKRTKVNDGEFVLTVKNKTHYDILNKIKESLELADLVPVETKERYHRDNQNNVSSVAGPSRQRSNVQPLLVGRTNSISQTGISLSRNASVVMVPRQEVGTSTCMDTPTEAFKNGISNGEQNMARTTEEVKIKQEKFYNVASFLESIKMSEYVNTFAEKGLVLMSQLDEFSEDDLKELHIGEAHRNVIWSALLRHPGHRHVQSGFSLSQASTCSTGSCRNQLPVMQVTRYRFKKVCNLTKDSDEDK